MARLQPRVQFYSVHPGICRTRLFRWLDSWWLRLLLKTPLARSPGEGAKERFSIGLCKSSLSDLLLNQIKRQAHTWPWPTRASWQGQYYPYMDIETSIGPLVQWVILSGAYYADGQMQAISMIGHLKHRTQHVFQFADSVLRATREARKKRN